MQSAARQGSERATVSRLDAFPDNAQFQDGLRAFQGWVASLVETYISLFGLIEGTAGIAAQLHSKVLKTTNRQRWVIAIKRAR